MAVNWQIYIVNLARSPQRWERIHNHLKGLGLPHKRVEAVDAQAFASHPHEYMPALNKTHYFSPLKTSEMACYLSHISALKQFLDNKSLEYAVVLEDDVEFVEDPRPVITKLIDEMHAAGVVKLYSKRNEHAVRQKRLLGGYCIQTPVRVPLGFQAQLWSRAAAIEFVGKWSQFYRPVDVDMQFKWLYGFSLKLVRPNLVRELSAEVGGSTISPSKSRICWSKVRLEILRPWFRLKLLVRSVVYTCIRHRQM